MPKIAPFLLRRKPANIPITQAGYDKLVAERARLAAERPDAVENLRRAREMGDLSENGYYKASRQRLSFIDARLRRLTDIIKRANVVVTANTGFVDIGSRVTIRRSGSEVTYTIVGGYESDPAQHLISHQSPLGKALMGKKAGDRVIVAAPAGQIVCELIAVA